MGFSNGAQYSFFDDTGKGTFAPAEECLNNLTTRVGLYGLNERFDEFTVLMGYLLGRDRMLAVPPTNVTDRIANPTGVAPKASLSTTERDDVTELLKDESGSTEKRSRNMSAAYRIHGCKLFLPKHCPWFDLAARA